MWQRESTTWDTLEHTIFQGGIISVIHWTSFCPPEVSKDQFNPVITLLHLPCPVLAVMPSAVYAVAIVFLWNLAIRHLVIGTMDSPYAGTAPLCRWSPSYMCGMPPLVFTV